MLLAGEAGERWVKVW